MHLEVGNKVGFNVSTAALEYGTVPKGGFGIRKIVIKNNKDVMCKVNINVTGNVSDFISVQREFYLEPYESKVLEVRADVPVSAKYGDYTGKFKIVMQCREKGWE